MWPTSDPSGGTEKVFTTTIEQFCLEYILITQRETYGLESFLPILGAYVRQFSTITKADRFDGGEIEVL